MAQQRLIHEHDAKIPASGKLVVTFVPKFKRAPSCSIANKTHPNHAITPEDSDSVDHLILKGHAGDVVHYECHGIIAGGKDEED